MLNHIHSWKLYNTTTRLNYVQQCMNHPHISCEALQSLLFPTFNCSLETPNRNPHVDGVAHSLHTHNLSKWYEDIQYIPRNMHTVFALLCFVVVIHWLIFPYPSGLLHWHCGNLTIAPVPAKQPWWIWINTSCEFIMNDCITTTKQSTTKPCAYFLGYTVQATTQYTLWFLYCRHGFFMLGKHLP